MKQSAGQRTGTARSTKGKQRVEEILRAATQVLIEEGYSSFKARHIANRVGIRLSNLQYYFPNQLELLNILLKRETESFVTAFDKHIASDSGRAESRMDFALGYVLSTQLSIEHGKFLKELWALASNNSDVAEIMDDFYDGWSTVIVRILLDIHPSLSRSQAKNKAVLIIAMVEGLIVVDKPTTKSTRVAKAFEKEVLAAIKRVAAP